LKMSENEKKLISKSRSSKPSLELYKPPVLRGKKSLPRKVQDVQSEFLEENIQKEISLLSSNEENKEEASQLQKSSLKIPSKPTEISQKQQKQLIKKSEEKVKPSMNFDDLINNLRQFLSKDLQNGNEIGEYLILNCSPEMAKYVGIFIVKYLVEDCCKNNKKYLKKGILSKLESILSLLMIIGHRLELDYPLQTDELRILLRNASLNSTECWARKMILLMVELGAVNWKIVPQIEEFYYTL
uniref:MIF4G domain-containing protein n=1 Tax=Meloidogyne javanica TaxID=6303 RepID=A0A915N8F0_MELJA